MEEEEGDRSLHDKLQPMRKMHKGEVITPTTNRSSFEIMNPV
jgi:hypothetical protein